MTHAEHGSRARGSLAEVAVAGIIRSLHATRRSGVLHLTRGDVTRRLYFRGGSIILAGSDQPEDRLGQVLVRTGLVQQADVEKALNVVDATDRTLGEALVQMGLLRPEQVQIEAARRTKQIVASLLDWDSGEYVFEERDERLEGEVLSEVDVPEVLLEWARGARGGTVVRQLLEDGKSVVQRPEHPSPTLGGLSLTASEQWALEQANGVSSAGEIAARSPMGEHEALRSLCGLLLAGVLVARSPKAPPTSTQLYLGPASVEPGVGTGLWSTLEQEQAEATSGFGTTGLQRKLPQSLGRYVVESAIGRGSMGAVLLARDPAIDRRVAVKLIQTSVQLTPNEWEKYKERFYREARAAGKLLHQGIVAIFDVGHTVEGVPFIVMEYVEGRTLSALAEEKELPLELALRIAIEALEALDYAHSQGVVHRDLKPANIMLSAEGRAKIMDFGVAHVVGSQMTQADEILGSPHFMAPEQLGKGKVDQRTDVFAFGVVLYWMLTGLLPFTGDSFAAIAQAILSERPVSPKDLKRTVPRELGKVVLRCLEKDPAKRFATAGELRAALQRIAKPPQSSRPHVVAVLLVLLATVSALYVHERRANQAEDGARAQAPRTARAARPSPTSGAVAAEPPAAAAPRESVPPPGPAPDATASPRPTASARPAAAAQGGASPRPRSEDERFADALPLSFSAKHSHRIGSCEGTLSLGPSTIEFRSREHESFRLRLAEVRSLERDGARSLKVETRERTYNFSLARPLSDADWTRYRRLARK
jgi:serine/threonine-protein kinase